MSEPRFAGNDVFASQPAAVGVPRSSFERMLRAVEAHGLRVQRRGDQAMVQCPSHDDHQASLHVTWQPSHLQGDRTLIHCHAGCETASILADLGLEWGDLYDSELPPQERRGRVGKSPVQRKGGRRRGRLGRLPARITKDPGDEGLEGHSHDFKPVVEYVYRDADGTVVQTVTRLECQCPHGKTAKSFRQAFANAQGRMVSSKPAEFVPQLYRQPEVARALAENRTVWLLEGEKDVHTAERLGLVATTNPGGAASFPTERLDQFGGHTVRIVLDRDGAGYRRGIELERELTQRGATVHLLLPATTAAKSDFTDHVEAGHGLDELIPVRVAELEAWLYVTEMEAAATRIRQASMEVAAHQQAEAAAGDAKQRTLHHERAVRWAHEAATRAEAMLAAGEQVSTWTTQSSTPWARDALTTASTLWAKTQRDVMQLHFRYSVPVPEALRAPQQEKPKQSTPQEPAEPQPAAAEETNATTHKISGGIRATAPIFRVVDGQIVQWESKKGSPPPPVGQENLPAAVEEVSRADDFVLHSAERPEGSWKMIMSTVVRIVAREFDETDDQDQEPEIELLGRSLQRRAVVNGLRQLRAYRIEYVHPDTGELMEARVPLEQWRDHSWLLNLPGAIDYDHKRAGLDVLQRAILAISAEAVDEVLHRSTGWCQIDGEWRFIHNGGAIGADGPHDVPVQLDAALSRFNLPDPVKDPAELQRLFWSTWELCERMPARVMVPLIGHVFRSVLRVDKPFAVVLAGSKATYKTSLAEKTMNYFGELWMRSHPGSSASGNGDTGNAVRYYLHHAKDAAWWVDDFSPTPTWSTAQKRLETYARMIFNSEERTRSSRDGQSVTAGSAPRSNGLFTSEVMPIAGSSAGTRIFPIQLEAGQIDKEFLYSLDAPQSRLDRAALMSSFLSWYAADQAVKRIRYRELANEIQLRFSETYPMHTDRESEMVAAFTVGWQALTDFAVEREMINVTEQAALLDLVSIALKEAVEMATDPDVPTTTAGRIREVLAFALDQGLVYCEDHRTGGMPPWPLAQRLGWQRETLDAGTQFEKSRDRRGKMRLGWVNHDPLPGERGRVIMAYPAQILAAIEAANSALPEKLEVDQALLARELEGAGLLLTPGGNERHKTLHCTIPAAGIRKQRMYVLDLDLLLNEPRDGDDDGQPAIPGLDAPQPTPHEPAPEPEAPAAPQPGLIPDLTPDARTTQQPEPPATSSEQAEETEVRQLASAPQPAPALHAPQQPARVVTASRTRFRASAAVADVDAIWCSNGDRVDWDQPLPTHVGELAELAQRLHLGTQVTKWRTENPQLWVTTRLAHAMGIDLAPVHAAEAGKQEQATRAATRGTAAVTQALAEGWQLGGEGDCLGRWTRVWKPQGMSTWIVLTPVLADDYAEFPLLHDDPEPAQLARRIGKLGGALGFPFHISDSTTGLDLMFALRWKDRDEFFAPHPPCEPAALAVLESDLNWCRRPTQEEQQHQWLHAYDRSGSYLAGVSGLELGIGLPQHAETGCAFDPKLPGYWRVQTPDEAPDWRLPNLLAPRDSDAGRLRWVTTPTLAFAIEQGYDAEIVEAYVWPRHTRIFEPWYERIRDARMLLDTGDVDDQAARDQLKGIYTKTIGMLGSKTFMDRRDNGGEIRRGYAPERRHLIVAKARTNILRRVCSIGATSDRWPVAMQTDTLFYTSSDPDPVKAWPGDPGLLGRKLGQYKPEGSALLMDQLQYLTGGAYRGKDALMGRAS